MDDKQWLVLPQIEPIFLRYVSIAIDYISGTFSEYDKPLLILGDSGVGKGMFIEAARQIMSDVSKSDKHFYRVNCASFEKNLAESELFGHIKGSFTGAIKDKTGIVASADKGLLILDEIGELPFEVQAKLLIFIEEGKYRPVGSNTDLSSDVKIIGTTNASQNKFRSDFWFRFFPIFIPPFHERRTDVLYYIALKYSNIFYRLTNQHLLSLLAHNWPGNIREIERVMSIMTFEESFKLRASKYFSSHGIKLKKNSKLSFPEDNRQTSLANIYLHEFYKKLYRKLYPVGMLNRIIQDYGLEIPEGELSIDEIVERNAIIEHGILRDYTKNNEDISLDDEKRMIYVPEYDEYYMPSDYYDETNDEAFVVYPTPKKPVNLIPCEQIYPFESIFLTVPNKFIEKAGCCFDAMCMIFLKDKNSKDNVFETDDIFLCMDQWNNDLTQDIISEFHKCGLIKYTIEHVAGGKINFPVKFTFKIPWYRYVEGLMFSNKERFGGEAAQCAANIFDSPEEEILKQYYSYLREKYRTVRAASKHAGINESTFRNKLRHFGLLPCQDKKDGSDK